MLDVCHGAKRMGSGMKSVGEGRKEVSDGDQDKEIAHCEGGDYI